jgi:HEAT repeat protein
VGGFENTGSSEAIPALLAYLRTCDVAACEKVARALARRGVRWIPAELMELLSNPDYTRRYAAAICLGAVGNRDALGPLVLAARDDVGMVRRGAVRALGELGDQRGVLALAAASRDPDPLVRRAAAGSLGHLGVGAAVLREVCRDPVWEVRRAGLQALARTAGAAAIPTLEEALDDPESQVREGAVEALTSLGAVEYVFGTLADDPRSDVRRVAAEALGRAGDRRAAQPLLGSLAREGAEMRPFVLLALRRVLGPGLEGFLAEALEASEAGIRRAAVNAMAELGASDRAPQIARLLDDPDHEVRFAVVGALGELRAGIGLVPLYWVLTGEDAGLRNAAVHALARIPGGRALLERASQDQRPEVREAAEGALTALASNDPD